MKILPRIWLCLFSFSVALGSRLRAVYSGGVHVPARYHLITGRCNILFSFQDVFNILPLHFLLRRAPAAFALARARTHSGYVPMGRSRLRPALMSVRIGRIAFHFAPLTSIEVSARVDGSGKKFSRI